MRIAPTTYQGLDLARVLLVYSELAPRLTLRTILQAGGYNVDVAGSTSEALPKLDTNQYDLVLMDAGPGNHNLLAYAPVKHYRPATATITSSEFEYKPRSRRDAHEFSICTADVPHLLEKVADLIAMR